MRYLVVCLNPTFQSTMVFPSFNIGEVNRSAEHYLDASGKGVNTARIISQNGEDATLFTHLGGVRRDEMIGLCEKDGIKLVHFDSQSEMRTCTTVLALGKTTELVEEPYPVKEGSDEKARELFEKIIDDYDAVAFCGTRCRGYSKSLYPDFVRLAKNRGKFVLLDICREDLIGSLPYEPDVIKPNLSEFCATFMNRKVLENDDNLQLLDSVREEMKKLYDRFGCTTVITRGKYDTLSYDGEFHTTPIVKADAINTIGCGDTVSAVLLMNMAKGMKVEDAVREASIQAAKVAENIRPGSLK